MQYVSTSEFLAARRDDVLGVAVFGSAAAAADADIPTATVGMPVLSSSDPTLEVWRDGGSAQFRRHQRVALRHTADLTFGCICLWERDFAAPAPAASTPAVTPLHAATTAIYQQICAALDSGEHPHLLRIWNYVPDINGDDAGTERYRRFNTARQHALRAAGRALTGPVPAASALGSPAGSALVVYFIAARQAPLFLENPRQMSAYHYPRRYGPHTPVFSRATLLQQDDTLTLFISGTASIVGHRSRHAGDAAAQTLETLANISALLQEANRAAHGEYFSLGRLCCKAYVRREQDLPRVQAQLAPAVAAGARVLYLRADICREDLLVEIEATAVCARGGGGACAGLSQR